MRPAVWQWIARMFKRILTRRGAVSNPREDLKLRERQAPRGYKAGQRVWLSRWESFLNDGVLFRDLLEEYLWEEEEHQHIPRALALMERLDLLCPISSDALESEMYLVPCVPLHYSNCRAKVGPADGVEEDRCICILDFKGFLPEGGSVPAVIRT
jgi:hypothetical protein